MQLAEERHEGIYLVRGLSSDGIHIGDQVFVSSVVITPEQVLADFSPNHLRDVDQQCVAELLTLSPEVVLIGTGERQQLPPPALMAAFLSRGIGLEAMDSRAAARTYNLLAGEGRRVVAVFLR